MILNYLSESDLGDKERHGKAKSQKNPGQNLVALGEDSCATGKISSGTRHNLRKRETTIMGFGWF